jgi:hypothetical protein
MLSITLKHHNKQNENININSVFFASSIQTTIDAFNQYRKQDSRISKLYNIYGQEIPNRLQIKENMVFFVDQPHNI